MFCTKCGSQLPEDVKFCPNCGEGVYEEAKEEKETTASAAQTGPVEIDSDITYLVDVKQEYYLPKFRQFKQLDKKTSWNWCAFLVPVYWMVYRKMYLFALCAWGLNAAVATVTDGVGGLLVNIVAGIFGNYLYMYHLEDVAKQASVLMPTEKQQLLDKKRGVSKGAVIALVAVNVGLTLLLVALFGIVIASVMASSI